MRVCLPSVIATLYGSGSGTVMGGPALIVGGRGARAAEGGGLVAAG
jgi:hypothetical protein